MFLALIQCACYVLNCIWLLYIYCLLIATLLCALIVVSCITQEMNRGRGFDRGRGFTRGRFFSPPGNYGRRDGGKFLFLNLTLVLCKVINSS